MVIISELGNLLTQQPSPTKWALMVLIQLHWAWKGQDNVWLDWADFLILVLLRWKNNRAGDVGDWWKR